MSRLATGGVWSAVSQAPTFRAETPFSNSVRPETYTRPLLIRSSQRAASGVRSRRAYADLSMSQQSLTTRPAE